MDYGWYELKVKWSSLLYLPSAYNTVKNNSSMDHDLLNDWFSVGDLSAKS